MKSLFIIFFLLVLCQMTSGLIREYFNIYLERNWTGARAYCRKKFDNLATITTENENTRAKNSSVKNPESWIGLKIKTFYSWIWDDGTPPTYFHWTIGQPDNYTGDENCASSYFGDWSDEQCSYNLPFICYRGLTLVTEKKTWEEALQYCRKYHIDLYSPASNTTIRLSEVDTIHPQTVSVWMGLRFLDGRWFWLNGWSVHMVSLPSCPLAQYRCGAQNTNTSVWENRDCKEKLNFLCY